MEIHDTHIHSKYSFDGCMEINEICEIAIANNIKSIAVTDHYDIDGILYGYYPWYDADAAYNDVMTAKDKYKDKLHITYGIEIGQAHIMLKEAAGFLNRYKYEFVIGSVHNIKDVPDFSFLNYEKMPIKLCERLWQRYLDEVYEMLLFDGIHTVAHLTYPIRYMKIYNKEIEYKKFCDSIIRIYKKMIERGLCLEINTSGLRQEIGVTMPDTELLKLYRECGGELITIGSDAHKPEHIGNNITDVYNIAKDIGFKYTVVYINGKPELINL